VVASVVASLLVAGFPVPQEPSPAPVARIAFVADAANPAAEEVRTLVQQELLALARSEFDVRFPDDLVLVADGTAGGVAPLLERVLTDDGVAVAVTQGFLSSQMAADGAPWPRPVIASTVFRARRQGFPEERSVSGVANLAYIAPPGPGPLDRDLRKFQEIAQFSTAALLIDEETVMTLAGVANRTEEAALRLEGFLERLEEDAAELEITLHAVPVGRTAASALDRLPPDAEAVYVTPLSRMAPAEFERLVAGLAERGLPSFAYSGDDVARGVMASLGTHDLPLLARRIAVNAYRILLGDDAATLPVYLALSEELVVNMRTVREVGVVPPLGVLLEARRLFETPEGVGRRVTLKGAMEEAMAASLALAAEDQAVLAGAEEIRLARANLLPNLEAGVTGATLAKSLAEASGGRNPQYNVDSGLSLRQLVFSQDATANVSIQTSFQASRQWDRAALELDVALDAAAAYLNVLRAKTLEQVQQDNLDLTLATLRLAEVRVRIGAAGPGERLRLESELARRRADRIDAYARRYAAEVSLNQVLNRPLDEQFLTPEADLEREALLAGSLATEYLYDLSRFNVLGDFLVDAAMRLAPELRSFDAVVGAQERLFVSARQAFYLPTVALQGSVSTNVLQRGAGSATAVGVTEYPWNAGLSVSLPVFEGSARAARRDRTASVLVQLRIQRELAAQRIEQNVRTQLQFARASLAIVTETDSAAETARKSLELVTEAYGQGLVSVVDLLEAQTSALLSERAVANAVYDYLINLKRVERAVGHFEVTATPEERGAFVRLLDEYAQATERGS